MNPLHDAPFALWRARVDQAQQWGECFAALALAGALPEGQGRIDLLAHAADLAYSLTGDCDALDALLSPVEWDDQVRAAARGRDVLRSVADAMGEGES